METFYIGRFSIAVPVEMQEAKGSRSHKLRDEEIKEIVWSKGINHEQAREAEWKQIEPKIMRHKKSKKISEIIIKTQDFLGLGEWAKGVFYYDSRISTRTAKWAILMDTGPVGVWIEDNPPVLVDKENKSNKAINNIINIGKSYRVMDSNAPKPKGDWFYLKHGAINLPYLWQEKSYIRFEGHPLNLKIEVEMHETYTVEKAGIIEKTIDAISTGYASGVKIKKVRSKKRTVAGLKGEEEVLRMTDKDKDALNFVWEYNGKENSGECPRIVITMESPDGNLEEKLKVWDAVLDSMKPMFEQKK